jgi:hypothetical protein
VAKLALAGLAVLLATCPATAQQHITQADLLRRVIDLQRLPTPPPAGAHTVRYSSRAGAAPRRTADDWDILLDGAGPGAITRLWLGQAVGDIRILVDGQPVIDTTADALLAGRLPPIVEPLVFRGTTSYFPIGFDQRCQVLRRGSTSAYEINAVQFPRGTEVEPFQLKLDDAAQAALVEVRKILKAGWTNKQLFGGQRLLPVAVEQELGPDEVLTDALENGGTVRALYVALTDRTNPPELYALHRCVLRIFVDGAKTPNVESPLCDFFGAGFDLSPVHSLIFGTDATLPIPLPERRSGEDRFMYCLLPMPFRDGLKVEIQNLNEDKRKIGLLLHMRVDTRPPAADALRFYARFRKEDPCRTTEYPLLETTSRGRLVGYLLNVDCPRPGWWGAGTDKLWVDRAKAPAYVGIDAAACFRPLGRGDPHRTVREKLGVSLVHLRLRRLPEIPPVHDRQPAGPRPEGHLLQQRRVLVRGAESPAILQGAEIRRPERTGPAHSRRHRDRGQHPRQGVGLRHQAKIRRRRRAIRQSGGQHHDRSAGGDQRAVGDRADRPIEAACEPPPELRHDHSSRRNRKPRWHSDLRPPRRRHLPRRPDPPAKGR